MNEYVCALCGEPFTHPARAVVCDACAEQDREMLRRRLDLHEILSSGENTLEAARVFARKYPEAAPIVQAIHGTLIARLPALREIVRDMQRAEQERRAKVYAVQGAK